MHHYRLLSTVLFLLIFIFTALADATRGYTGFVRDADGQPIEFATVRIPGRNFGMLTDSTGLFKITDGRYNPLTDSLNVSQIGYSPCSLPLSRLSHDSLMVVTLVKAAMPLPELTVRPKKYKTRKAGKKHSSGMLRCCYAGQTKGETVGHEFHAGKGKSMWLDKVGFYVLDDSLTVSKMPFRINIYDMSEVEGSTTDAFVNVLPEPIEFMFRKEDVAEGIYTYSLPEIIRLPKDAMVEIQFLDDLDDKRIYYKCNLVGKKTWMKEIDEDFWLKQPFASPFFIECLELRD